MLAFLLIFVVAVVLMRLMIDRAFDKMDADQEAHHQKMMQMIAKETK